MSAALVASAGTGKTIALCMLVAALPDARFQIRYVKVSGLSPRDFCREIAAACGLPDTGTYPAPVRRLQDVFAQSFDSDGLRPVLVHSEAHDLRPKSLAMLRLLTNFEWIVVSVVLAGQLHLRTLLARPDQAAMAQRLVHYGTLPPLPRRDPRLSRPPLAPRPRPSTGTPRDNLRDESRRPARDRLARGQSIQLAAKAGDSTFSMAEVTAARQLLVP